MEEESSTLRARGRSEQQVAPEEPTAERSPSVNSRKHKTFGRTPGGRAFVVPQTHDMVSTLLSPTQPKKTIDVAILGVLAFDIALYLTLPSPIRTPVLLFCFLFWRTAYNFGIGYLLQAQSKYNQLVHWAVKYGIFDPKKQPVLYKVIREDIESKVADEVKNGDYVFDDAPIEYNTWLVFRRVVDLILMNDFVTYVLFAASCAHQPEGEAWYLTAGRWIGGIILFLFNLWVKLDAHRVVKDYAWYWGDFFYLIDQTLTFDGVFEMVPHPMYSVGYAGYYGISLFAASYTVLFVSLAAHIAQFVFLTKVENPHIEKTYNPPAPRRKSVAPPPENLENPNPETPGAPSTIGDDVELATSDRPLVQAPDLWNSTHFGMVLLVGYVAALALLTPNTRTIQALLFLHAFSWRLWSTVGIGAILVGQSENKRYVRHFLKYGESFEDAWRQWKSLYYVSTCMTHSSFVAAAWKLYNFPGLDERMALFRHTVGVMFIALHIWTAFSIYDSLGEFGWFYGDFFFDSPRPHLTYSGIYRYLNNPERLIGCAGIWGIVLIANSAPIFLLGLFAHLCALTFINLVERPHMQKLYGSQIRREAGVAKTIRKAIPHPLAGHVEAMQKIIDSKVNDYTELLEEMFARAAQRLPKVMRNVVQGTQSRLHPGRIAVGLLGDTTQDDEVITFDRTKYSISINNAVRQTDTLTVLYGEPIRITYKAPKTRSPRDWIGLYRIADNASRKTTRIASMGRWVAVQKDQYETTVSDIGIISEKLVKDSATSEEYYTGEVEFAGEKLFWTNGVYEFRYHHDGRHTVMAISKPFEIQLSKIALDAPVDAPSINQLVEKELLAVTQRAFENDAELAPQSLDDEFVGLQDEKYARRIIYAVKEMFGVDFAPSVVRADGNVRRLAWRICNARKVLAPFSGAHVMSPSAESPCSPPASPKPM